MKAASLLLCVVLMCTAVHYASSAITCESFDQLVAGTVYSNATGYTPGTSVTSNTYLQFFRDVDGKGIAYIQMSIVPSFSAFGTSGNAADLKKVNIEFSFRGAQVKYVSFDFLDSGNTQNLRVNKDRLYKGSMVTMGGVVASDVAFKPRYTRRFLSNHGELFAVNGQTINDLWIGGDELTIDNVCWDTAYHPPPIIPVASRRLDSENAASVLTALPLLVLAAVAVAFAF